MRQEDVALAAGPALAQRKGLIKRERDREVPWLPLLKGGRRGGVKGALRTSLELAKGRLSRPCPPAPASGSGLDRSVSGSQ